MNLLETIGETPLIALPSFSAELSGVTLLAKAEFMNPSGSVKDRAAKAMILDGIARGLLTPDKTIIDATSGNTGIALRDDRRRAGVSRSAVSPAEYQPGA